MRISKTLLTLLLLPFFIPTKAQQVIFLENFTGGFPLGWTLLDVDTNAPDPFFTGQGLFLTQTWEVINITTPNLGEAAFSLSDFDGNVAPNDSADDWMISEGFPLPTFVTLGWEAVRTAPADRYQVWLATSLAGGTPVPSDFTIKIFDGIPDSSQVWTEESIDLTPYGGQNLWVAFRNISVGQALLGIDNMTLTRPFAKDGAISNLQMTGVETYTTDYLTPNQTYVVEPCGLDTTTVSFDLTNVGLNGIAAVIFNYAFNLGEANQVVQRDTVIAPGALVMGQTSTHTFAQGSFPVSNDESFTITAWLDVIDDSNPANDTMTWLFAVNQQTQAVPFNSGFEQYDAGLSNPQNLDNAWGWTFDDANTDGNSWTISAQSFASAVPNTGSFYMYNPANSDDVTPADDWAFSPCLDLDSACDYRLTFSAAVGSDTAALEEMLEVGLGTSAEVGAMNILSDLGTLSNTAYQTFTVDFTATASGTHHIGLHAKSAAGKSYLAIDDFSLTKILPPPCLPPSNTRIDDATCDAVVLAWDTLGNASGYEVWTGVVGGDTTITTLGANDTALVLTGLSRDSVYFWKIRTLCQDSSQSAYTCDTFTTFCCDPPDSIWSSNVNSSGATLNWTPAANALAYKVIGVLTSTGQSTTVFVIAPATTYLLSTLSDSSEFAWTVASICDSVGAVVSLLSQFDTFTTLTDPCVPPDSTWVTALSGSEATLNWTAVPAAVGYKVVGSLVGGGGDLTIPVPAGQTSFTLSGLTEETSYVWAVRTSCDSTGTFESNLTPLDTFTTTASDCIAPDSLFVTGLGGNTAVLNWTAVAGAVGYKITGWVAGQPGSVQILLPASMVSFSVSTLNPLVTYVWNVATICNVSLTDVSPPSANDTFTTTVPMVCEAPDTVNSSNITSAGATLTWNAVAGAVTYRVIGVLTATNDVLTVVVPGNQTSLVLTTLPDASEFVWGVRTVCDTANDLSVFSPLDTFSTLMNNCVPPDSVYTTGITASGATLNWSAVPGAVGYNLIGGVVGSPSVVTLTLPAGVTSFTASALSPLTSYVWVVKTICDSTGTKSLLSDLDTFTTSAPKRLGADAEAFDMSLSVYPNPAQGFIKVSLSESVENAEVLLLDLQGRTLQRATFSGRDVRIDRNGLPTGLYLIEVRAGATYRSRVVFE